MGSSEAHARRRITEFDSDNPALVDQLMKDLKKEIRGGRQGQTVEQMRRMMGAAATRSFLHLVHYSNVLRRLFITGYVEESMLLLWAGSRRR